MPLENPELSEPGGIILLIEFQASMSISAFALLAAVLTIVRSQADLQLENLALHHQIGVFQRSVKKRPELTSRDSLLWPSLQ